MGVDGGCERIRTISLVGLGLPVLARLCVETRRSLRYDGVA